MHRKRGKRGSKSGTPDFKEQRPGKRVNSTGTTTMDVNMDETGNAEDGLNPTAEPVLETDLDMEDLTPQVDQRIVAEAAKEKGNEYYKQKDYKNALLFYSEAIACNPSEASYYSNRSACYMMMARYKNALEDAVTCTSLQRDFLKGYLREAKCRNILGDALGARQSLNKAEELAPGNPAIDAELQNCKLLENSDEQINRYATSGDYRSAVHWCQRALAIACASSRHKVLKAEYLARLKKYHESQEIVNDVLQVETLNADAIYVRGLCLYYDDQVDKAFQHFQQTMKLAPDHVKAKITYRMAKALKNKKEEGNNAFKMGNLQEAEKCYSEALKIDPANVITNSKLYCNRAAVNMKLGSTEQALSDCNKAIELDENYLKAYMRRGRCYQELEQHEEAVRDFEYIWKKDQNSENRRMLQDAKLELKKSKRKDYYKILGINKNASEDEIKKAYRKRALVHHPDRHASATDAEKKEQEKKFKDIGEAYSVLSDNKKRARYDQGQDLDDGMDFGGCAGEFNPFNLFQATFGGAPSGFTFSSMGGEMPEGVHSFPGGFSFQFG